MKQVVMQNGDVVDAGEAPLDASNHTITSTALYCPTESVCVDRADLPNGVGGECPVCGEVTDL